MSYFCERLPSLPALVGISRVIFGDGGLAPEMMQSFFFWVEVVLFSCSGLMISEQE